MQSVLTLHNLPGADSAPVLHDHEFELLSGLLFQIAGISMTPVKKTLVASRLMKRLKHYDLSSFNEYYRLITAAQGAVELQTAIDLLTTNETHFFREPQHFDFLMQHIIPARNRNRSLRIWSAACSSGEEAYTLAMLLDDALDDEAWEIVASDLSTRVLARARDGIYPAERIAEIPKQFLFRYFLKGVGSRAGVFRVVKKLRQRIHFFQHNLTAPSSALGEFDVIFLRNVLIYFNRDTKRLVVNQLLPSLRDGGYLLTSHSESLSDLEVPLESQGPSIYRKLDCKRHMINVNVAESVIRPS